MPSDEQDKSSDGSFSFAQDKEAAGADINNSPGDSVEVSSCAAAEVHGATGGTGARSKLLHLLFVKFTHEFNSLKKKKVIYPFTCIS